MPIVELVLSRHKFAPRARARARCAAPGLIYSAVNRVAELAFAPAASPSYRR